MSECRCGHDAALHRRALGCIAMDDYLPCDCRVYQAAQPQPTSPRLGLGS